MSGMTPDRVGAVLGVAVMLWAAWVLVQDNRQRRVHEAMAAAAAARTATRTATRTAAAAAAAATKEARRRVADSTEFRNPLEPLLENAVDAVPPAVAAGALGGAAQDLSTGASSAAAAAAAGAADGGEARVVALEIVRKINARSPRAQLTLVGVESARKAVDQYKTIRYDLVFNVHAAGLGMGARLFAVALVSKGTVYLFDVSTASAAEAAAAAADGPEPAATGLAAAADYAPFDPAI